MPYYYGRGSPGFGGAYYNPLGPALVGTGLGLGAIGLATGSPALAFGGLALGTAGALSFF